jgi:hypothetical protein
VYRFWVFEPVQPASADEIDRLLRSSQPFAVMGTGVLGLLVILWLMVYKPY